LYEFFTGNDDVLIIDDGCAVSCVRFSFDIWNLLSLLFALRHGWRSAAFQSDHPAKMGTVKIRESNVHSEFVPLMIIRKLQENEVL
jgi:hypothetical protein